jgi:hypothetical protein
MVNRTRSIKEDKLHIFWSHLAHEKSNLLANICNFPRVTISEVYRNPGHKNPILFLRNGVCVFNSQRPLIRVVSLVGSFHAFPEDPGSLLQGGSTPWIP